MALTKQDLKNIKAVVTESNDELARLVTKGIQETQDLMNQGFKRVDVELVKINNKLDKVDVWQSDFRDLVKILAAKNVLTPEEAVRLGVQLEQPKG